MPGAIDFETMDVDELTPVWFPSDEEPETPERYESMVRQEASARLMTMVGVPEAVLRLLVGETEVSRVPRDVGREDEEGRRDFEAGGGAGEAGAAEDELPPDSFEFSRPITAETVEMTREGLLVIYRLEGAGTWRLFLESERVMIERV